jgi:propionyl-CoA carboxylase beta chain
MNRFKKKLKEKMSTSKARERIEKLLDKGSFTEFHVFTKLRIIDNKKLVKDGVVTGYGRIDSRKVFV